MSEKITSRKNPEIARIKKLGTSAQFRRQEGVFLCEGTKLLGEALLHGADIETVLVCEGCEDIALPRGRRVITVPRELLEYVSTQKTPNDVLFTCRYPMGESAYGEGSHIILENVQDPGNVGAVIRTASAFGISRIVLLGECADPFGPKAVRASMGAVFRVAINFSTYEETAEYAAGHPVYAAALGEGCMDVRDADFTNAVLAIGSEGQGLSDRLLDICNGRVRIPMLANCESLNAAAAAAVLMWEMRGKTLPR